MPTLDGCVGSLFEPGSTGSSSGTPPTIITPPSRDTTPPVFLSDTSGNNVEGVVLAFTVTTDEDATVAITGGLDPAQFEFATTSLATSHVLRWVGDGVQSFGSPADSDANNTYIVQITATDASSNQSSQVITITVVVAAGVVIGLLAGLTKA